MKHPTRGLKGFPNLKLIPANTLSQTLALKRSSFSLVWQTPKRYLQRHTSPLVETTVACGLKSSARLRRPLHPKSSMNHPPHSPPTSPHLTPPHPTSPHLTPPHPPLPEWRWCHWNPGPTRERPGGSPKRPRRLPCVASPGLSSDPFPRQPRHGRPKNGPWTFHKRI